MIFLLVACGQTDSIGREDLVEFSLCAPSDPYIEVCYYLDNEGELDEKTEVPFALLLAGEGDDYNWQMTQGEELPIYEIQYRIDDYTSEVDYRVSCSEKQCVLYAPLKQVTEAQEPLYFDYSSSQSSGYDDEFDAVLNIVGV